MTRIQHIIFAFVVQLGRPLLFLIINIIVCGSIANAQTYPVQTNLNIAAPYSVYLSDYTTLGSMRFGSTVYLADLSKPSVDIRFRLIIEGSGVELRTKTEYIGTRETLLSGVPTQYFGDQLKEYFNINNLEIIGLSRNQLESTGALPEGVYRFTLEVLEYYRGVKISNSASSTVWLILNDPPILNLPLDQEIVTASDPQIVRFQWTPRHKGSPNASFNTEYLLKIVEVWPETRNPNDAILTSNPIFEVITTAEYFIYNLAQPALIPGRTYAFSVQARANSATEQLDLFKNNGVSQVRSFQFGQQCNSPSNIELLHVKNHSLEIGWEAPETATGFGIMYREMDNSANWFEKFSYLPRIKLDQLQPGTKYELMVKSNCTSLSSEFSKPFQFVTENNTSEFSCSELDIKFDLSNKSPIGSLWAGEVVFAGDFEIEILTINQSLFGFSGTGVTNLPFLNMARTVVSFENIRVNTDYRVYDGSFSTLYNIDSEMLSHPDNPGDVIGSDTTQGSPSDSLQNIPSDSITLPFEPAQPIAVDTVFVNDNGEIVAVIDSNEVVLDDSNPNHNFIDENGNTYSIGDNGSLQSNSGSTSGVTPAVANSINENIYQFGPLKILLNEELPDSGNENCVYNGIRAQIELTLEDIDLAVSKELKLKSAVVSLRKNCETGKIISGHLDWDNAEDPFLFNLFGYEVEVFQLAIDLDSIGIVSGTLDLFASLHQDKALNKISVLKKGAEGRFKYSLERKADELVSKFDFKGIENISVEIIKQGQLIGKLTNGVLASDGSLEGNIQLVSEVEYSSNQFRVRLNKLNFDVRYSFGKDLVLKKGKAVAIISDISNMDGQVKVSLDILENDVSATIESTKLKAFGMELTDLNLKALIDNELNFTSIYGSASSSHPDFGVEVDVREFKIEYGQLLELSLTGNISYDGIDVNIQEASVNNTDNQLIIDAYVELEQTGVFIAAQITDFRINGDGTIVWGGYDISFDGIKTFGPMTVALSGESATSSGTWRETTATASITLELAGAEDPFSISNAQISYKKHRSKDRYRDIIISLEDADLKVNLGMLETTLSGMNMVLESPENYIDGDGTNASTVKLSSNSYLRFNVTLNNDLELGNLLYVQKGVNGSIEYLFNGDKLNGNFDYSNINNLNIVARKGEQILASLNNGSIDEAGLLLGDVSVLPNATFNSNGFSLKVVEMNYSIELPLFSNLKKFKINSGKGSLELSNVGSLDGSILLDYHLDDQQNTLCSINNSSNISIYDLQLSDFDLKAELNQELELIRVSGHMVAQHEEFNNYLKVSKFLVEDGKLIDFDMEGAVKFKGFNLKINKADFTNDILALDGEVAISITGTSAWLAIEEMTIDPNGIVSINGIEGELDKSPVLIGFSANLEEARFKGSFTGELSGIGLSGSIDIGVQDDSYNFAYLELVAQGNVPLPGTGLKLTQLGGQFGYNYKLVYKNAGDKPEGNPQEGNYVVGLLIGVADMANVVEVSGNAVVQFGNDKFDLNLNGSISIPKENSIAQGNVNIHYILPDNTLEGNVALDLSVPPSSGKLIAANFDMNYLRANQKWSLNSTDISAKLFSEIDFTGNLELAGDDENPGIEGLLSGSASYEFKYSSEAEAFGMKLLTTLDAGFNFNGEIAFSNIGANGEVSLYIFTNGEIGVESDVGGYDKLIAISGTSLSKLSITPSEAKIYGNLDVTVYLLGLEHAMEVEIDHTI